jgi:hypothetical protein
MKSKVERTLFKSISLLPDGVGHFIAKRSSKNLISQWSGELTDECLEALLKGMDFVFQISKGYRKNIKNFRGGYVFRTKEGRMVSSATFEDGNMEVHEKAIPDWNVRVTFKNQQAFWKFLFSKNQDILGSILANEVEVDGNLNYLYRFGFLARDLGHRLGAF